MTGPKSPSEKWRERQALTDDEAAYVDINEILPGYNDYSSGQVLDAYRAGKIFQQNNC